MNSGMWMRRRPWPALVAPAALVALLAGCQSAPPLQLASVRDTQLSYQVHGRHGPPVVLVHGCCSDQRGWPAEVLALAAGGRRIVTFDQRYYGTGRWPDQGEKFSTETQTEDLAAFLRALGLGPVQLVGWSMSGASVIGVALRQPQLVERLFVYEPSIPSAITDPAEQKAAAENRAAFIGPVLPLVKAGDHAAALRRMMDGVDGRPGAFDALPADFRANQVDHLRVLPVMFSAAPSPPLSCAQMAQVKVPATIVRGDASQPFYRIASDAVARCLGNARRVVIPGARHLWPAQEPAAFAATLQRWLDGG